MKRLILPLLYVSVMLFTLSACFHDTKIIFADDLVYCDVIESGDKFGFNVIYLYKGTRPDIEFISFDSQNANAMFEEMIDDTFETIADKKYKGYTAVILGFLFDTSSMNANDVLTINVIELSVNGQKTELNTSGQIAYTKISGSDERYSCNSLYSTNVPIVIFSQCNNINGVFFNYRTEEVVTLEKFEFTNFIQIESSCVYIDEQKLGSIEDVFPLTVEPDKTITIEIIDTDLGEYDSFSDFYLNSLLYYSDNEGSGLAQDYFAIQAVGNFEDLSILIDHMIR